MRVEESPVREELSNACFEYLSQGGTATSGPLGLLGGLSPNPPLAILHFTFIALHGIKRALLGRGAWMVAALIVHTICLVGPVIRAEGVGTTLLAAFHSPQGGQGARGRKGLLHKAWVRAVLVLAVVPPVLLGFLPGLVVSEPGL